jgi:hypothetical protein
MHGPRQDGSSELNAFLEKLADTAIGNEVLLSRVTLAALSVNPPLLKCIADQFEFDLDFSRPVEIEREYPLGDGSRVDLAFLQDDGDSIYLLENKIYDQDYHFEYEMTPVGKKAKALGLVSAHKVLASHSEKWKVLTWNQVVGKLKTERFTEAQPLVDAFCKYIERVCQMLKIERIDTLGAQLQSLFFFCNLARAIIEEHKSANYDCKLYPAGRSCGPGWAGHHFQLTKGEKHTYPWFGVLYADSVPKIAIHFEKDWCPQFSTDGRFPRPNPEMYEVSKKDGTLIVMADARYEEFLRESKESQRYLLTSFFARIVAQVPEYWKEGT